MAATHTHTRAAGGPARETLPDAAGAAVWEALGTTAVLHVSRPQALARAREILAAELEAIDLTASRFREDSELERVNARAGTLTAVSAALHEALSVALRAARLSAGLVDPTIGVALIEAGYDRDRSALTPLRAGSRAQHTETAPEVAQRRPSWWEVRLIAATAQTEAAVLLPRGMRLDLGATAKALAADRAAARIAQATGAGTLVSLGGDIATAGEPPAGGWQVHVTDDHRSGPDAVGQTVTVSGGALATSSTTVLRWLHAGRPMHHIIDPRTGRPAAGPWRTVSVTAGSCVDANTASTAAILLGEAAPAWLEQRALPARLVSHAGHVTTVAGWPAEQRC